MRVYNYIIIVVGLMILFNLAGFDTSTSWVSRNLGWDNSSGFALTPFFILIGGIFALSVVGGIVIGYFTKAATESILLVPYAAILLYFVVDMLFVLTYMDGLYGETAPWLVYVVTAVLFPLAVGFAHSIVSWWGGKA